MTDKKLNFIAPINRTSYGYHSSYVLKHLIEKDFDVRHIGIGRNDPDPKFKIPTGLFHHNAPCLRLWHQFNLAEFVGSPKIGYSVFELEDLNEIEIHNIKNCDKFITATKWGASVCEKYGIDAKVVPLGFDPDIFKLTEIQPSDTTVFGNFGKFEIRKGHDVLVKAFNAAFSKEDNVALALMPSNPFLRPEQHKVWERMYLESKLGSKIQIIPRVETHAEVANIMAQISCAVFPARAEGFNLEALECLAMGRHVIITNCTGHTEFVNSESCRLIDMTDSGFEKAYDGIFFTGQGNWRKFGQNQFDQLVENLRAVHRDRPNLKTNLAGHQRAMQFQWKDVVDVLAKEITF